MWMESHFYTSDCSMQTFEFLSLKFYYIIIYSTIIFQYSSESAKYEVNPVVIGYLPAQGRLQTADVDPP